MPAGGKRRPYSRILKGRAIRILVATDWPSLVPGEKRHCSTASTAADRVLRLPPTSRKTDQQQHNPSLPEALDRGSHRANQ